MRRCLIALLLSLFIPVSSWAAVAFDARSEGLANPGTSLTVAHTVTGSNVVLYVACTHQPGSGVDVTNMTATYNGVSMGVKFTDTTTNGSRHVRVFRLVGASTGTNNWVISWGGANVVVACIAASYTGVDQVTPDDANGTTDGSAGGTSTTQDVSSATGNMVMDVVVLSDFATLPSAGSGQTLINDVLAAAGSNGLFGTYESGATTVTMDDSWVGFVSYVQWAWDINAGSGAAAPTFGYYNLLVVQ